MSIDKILERISTEADKTAGEIIEKAKAEAARIGKSYSVESDKITASMEVYAGKKSREEEKHLLVSEQLELSKMMLARKHEMLDEIYAEAKKRILALDDREKRKILKSLIVSRAITGKEEIVPAASGRALFTRDFIRELSDEFGSGASFTLSESSGSFSWGVVLKEGRRVVDLSLDVVFEQLKEKIEPEVAVLLFQGDL